MKRALQLIDSVHEAVRTHPNDLVLATTAADIRRAAAEKKIAALMGMEGGHMIDDDLGTLRDLRARSASAISRSRHFKNNNWADSSTDKPEHNGLTDFGKDVVRELNRLGVMVDISHVADKTFADVLELTTVPVIASHSSCRAIANHPRNMTDDMMRALAKNGGVIMINYEVSFLSEENRLAAARSPAAWWRRSTRCRRSAAATRPARRWRSRASRARRWTRARCPPCRGRRSSSTSIMR